MNNDIHDISRAGGILSLDIKIPRTTTVFLITIATIVLLGIMDYLTGYEVSFSIFYLVPITFASTFSGRRMGLGASLLCVISWLFADLSEHHYSHFLIPYWNASVRGVYFMLHTFVLTELLRLYNISKKVSLFDGLTGAAGRVYFEEFCRRVLSESSRTMSPLTMAYLDLDNFKKINDGLGHAVGDEVLKSLSAVVAGRLRGSDLFARLGGDEFVIVLVGADYVDGKEIIDRICATGAEEMRKRGWPVTLSIGSVTFTQFNLSIEEMIRRVDELMYEAKRRGKNTVVHELWPPDAYKGDTI